jgi:RNA polymerase sigma-70 factor (ECF subfamily)
MNQEELFREAIRENDRRIYSVCCHFFGPGEEAKDAYQEVLLKIWLNIKNFRGDSQLKTWISRIAVNVCLTFISKTKKRSSLVIPFSQIDFYDNICDDEDNKHEDELKIKFFEEFKSKLNPVDKSLVTLYLEDIEYREISQITGLSEVNARARIHRIKKQIKEKWEERNGTR